MRNILKGLMVLAICSASAARAEDAEPGGERRVELILMGRTAAQGREDGAADIGVKAEPRAGARRSGPEMLVFGPNARSIERRMVARLNERMIASDPGEAFVDRDTDGGEPEPVAPASSIVVPMWMRPGAAAPSPAWRFAAGCAPQAYRATGFLSSDAELRRASYYGMMSRIACEYGVPEGLFDALIIQESRYHPTIVSPKNAFGLTQLMPATAAGLGVDRYSVEGNLRGGARYLRQQLDSFGQYHLALAAYNAGPGRVRGGVVPRIRETQDYVGSVLSNWSRLSRPQRVESNLPTDRTALQEAIVRSPQHRSAAIAIY